MAYVPIHPWAVTPLRETVAPREWDATKGRWRWRRKRKPLIERFWPKVNKSGPVLRADIGACWTWTGVCRRGYGIIERHDDTERVLLAHRVSWTIANGAIPDGLLVCHKCDNPPCVNPDHLFLGDHKANAADMIAKGRGRFQKGSTT